MRPHTSAPYASSPIRPDSASLNSDLADLLRARRSSKLKRQGPSLTPAPATGRVTAPNSAPKSAQTGADQKMIRYALARSSEEEVSFFLQRMAGGLYVEREAAPSGGTRTSQSLVFADRNRFEHWISEDPARFRHPLLHAQLKRDGDALWALGDG